MLVKRIVSALLGIPLLILIVYEGKLIFLAGVVFFTLAGVYELNKLLLRMNLRVPKAIMYGNGVLFPIVIYYLPRSPQAIVLYAGITCYLMLHLVAMIVSYPRYSVAEIAVSYLGSSYIGILTSYMILVRHLSQAGFYFLLYILVLTWAYDTGAYFTGVFWGRRHLWPLVSPQKTLEGVVGGLLVTVCVALIFQRWHPMFSYFDTVALGLLIGIFVQIGDLVESALKRMAGVKDSGTLIPGHGGILDRFDGLLFSVPVAYFYLSLILFR